MKLLLFTSTSIIVLWVSVTIYCLAFAFSVGMGLLLFGLSIVASLLGFARKMRKRNLSKDTYSNRKHTLYIDEKGELRVWNDFDYESGKKNGTIQKQLRDNNFI